MPQEAGDIIDHYEILRDYVKHEDNLVNQRLSWLLTLHGFLYGSLALIVSELFKIQVSASSLCAAKGNFLEMFSNSCARIELFVYFICSVGLWIAYSVRHSIKGALIANNCLVELSKNLYNIHRMNAGNEAMYFISKRDSSGNDHFFPWLLGGCSNTALLRGFSAPKFIPIIIIISWSIVILIHSAFSFVLSYYFSLIGLILISACLVLAPLGYFEFYIGRIRRRSINGFFVPRRIVQVSYIDDGTEPLVVRNGRSPS